MRFNERILLDTLTIEEKPVLHVVNKGIVFSAARFVPDVLTKSNWCILEHWVIRYTGIPNHMVIHQRSYVGNPFAIISASSNVDVQRTGVEAHSGLGLGERYHQSLGNTYREIMME